MAEPIVSWYESDNETVISKWDIGIVDAGTESEPKTLLIWNNREGEGDVSNMQHSRITTTDGAADTLEVVKDKWIQCKVDSILGDDFDEIGGVDELDEDETIIEQNSKDIAAEGEALGIIKGAANNGTLAAIGNFAKVTLKAAPPLSASAGKQLFKIRVAYYYT